MCYILDSLHEWNTVQEELFCEFWFASHHETFKMGAVFLDELKNGILGQTHCVADVKSSQFVQFPCVCEIIKYLQVSQSVHFWLIYMYIFHTQLLLKMGCCVSTGIFGLSFNPDTYLLQSTITKDKFFCLENFIYISIFTVTANYRATFLNPIFCVCVIKSIEGRIKISGFCMYMYMIM